MAEYINRKEALHKISINALSPIAEVYKAVEVVPVADVQPVVHGRWNATHESGLFSHPDSITYVCSECGKQFYTLYSMPPLSNYCPNCGADMRGE